MIWVLATIIYVMSFGPYGIICEEREIEKPSSQTTQTSMAQSSRQSVSQKPTQRQHMSRSE